MENDVQVGEPKRKAAKPKTSYLAQFTQNRRFELSVGGKIVDEFGPHEARPIGDDVRTHPDFLSLVAQGFFIIQEE